MLRLAVESIIAFLESHSFVCSVSFRKGMSPRRPRESRLATSWWPCYADRSGRKREAISGQVSRVYGRAYPYEHRHKQELQSERLQGRPSGADSSMKAN